MPEYGTMPESMTIYAEGFRVTAATVIHNLANKVTQPKVVHLSLDLNQTASDQEVVFDWGQVMGTIDRGFTSH